MDDLKKQNLTDRLVSGLAFSVLICTCSTLAAIAAIFATAYLKGDQQRINDTAQAVLDSLTDPISIMLAALLVTAVALVSAALVVRPMSIIRKEQGQCVRCGYELEGLVESDTGIRCPECGSDPHAQ